MLRTIPFTIRDFDLAEALLQAVARTAGMLYFWQDRAEQRYRLAELDQRELQDIGISRRQALAEARKPFWWS